MPRHSSHVVAAIGAALLVAALRGAAPLSARSPIESDSAIVRAQYVKHEYRIPMRDGARLFTTVYVPKDASLARRYPIVLTRTPFSVAPYGPDAYAKTLGPDGVMLRERYIFVAQDVRGRYMSEGTWDDMRPLLPDSVRARHAGATDEATDTFDTIDWLVQHVDGNSGRVGIWGISYAGFYAALGMLSRHPALVAASPQAPATDAFYDDFHHNGALTQAYFSAYPIFGVPRPAPTSDNWWLPQYLAVTELGAGNDYAFQLALGPLRNTTARYYADNTLWRAIVAHPSYDAYWQSRAVAPRLRGVSMAVLVVGGWFDAEDLYGPLAVYRALRTHDPHATASIVMGPFGHRGWAARDAAHTTHGDLYFGDSLATRFQRDVEAPFFRATLKAARRPDSPAALMFDTGRKRWMRFARWPAPNASRGTFYLHADGSLSSRAPVEPHATREYVSDPAAPVPSRCAGRQTIESGTIDAYMSDDQRCYVGRSDVLTFQSEPLRDDVTFAGPITARLHVSTTGTDADYVVKVIDVYPATEPDPPFQRDSAAHLAGYHQLVRGEIMRARFRRSFAAPMPMVPNALTDVAIPLQDVLHTFRKGHRIMVQVQSSWFPAFDRNPQRYVPSIYQANASDFIAATQRVFVQRSAASAIEVGILR